MRASFWEALESFEISGYCGYILYGPVLFFLASPVAQCLQARLLALNKSPQRHATNPRTKQQTHY